MKIRNISEALLPRPKVEYYIDRIIRPASLNMFHAEPGTGKSLAFIHLGICFTSHEIKNWLGFETNNKGKILFIQEEMGDDGFLEFMEETYRGYFGDEQIKMDFDFLVYPGLNFVDEKSVSGLYKIIEENEYKIIFIDSFAATFGDDENSKKDVQPALNRARNILNVPHKPALVFTHHPVKNGGGYRGSSAIKAALDVMVSMKNTGASNTLEFKMEKNRYKPCITWNAQKKFSKDDKGNDVFILERVGMLSDLEEGQKVMITIIENNPELGQDEISNLYVHMGGKKSHVSTILKMLDDSEITEVVNDSSGGRGKKKIRQLTEAYVFERMTESLADAVK